MRRFRKQNYGVRAVKTYGDEIGRLIDGFNTMLSEIQQRDTVLQSTTANEDQDSELEEEIFHRKQTQEELLNAKHAAEEPTAPRAHFSQT